MATVHGSTTINISLSFYIYIYSFWSRYISTSIRLVRTLIWNRPCSKLGLSRGEIDRVLTKDRSQLRYWFCTAVDRGPTLADTGLYRANFFQCSLGDWILHRVKKLFCWFLWNIKIQKQFLMDAATCFIEYREDTVTWHFFHYVAENSVWDLFF